MSRPGPAPKPTHIKLVGGNAGKRPINKDEPLPAVAESVPAAPQYLSEDEAKVWDATAAKLFECGLLTEADEEALALYCVTFQRWKWAEAKLKEPPHYEYVMTKEAMGVPRDEYIKQGWTDAQLVAWGYMLEPELIDAAIVKTKTGYMAHSPYLTIANKCFDQLKAMLQEFGMTPAARSRVTAKPPEKGDAMANFLKQK